MSEAAIVDAARISPLDATNLINEVDEKKRAEADQNDNSISADDKYKARRKLAGDTFFSFSAFFVRQWRENDIMWGRLDAAERLISIVLPKNLSGCQEIRKEAVEEIHESILRNEQSIQSAFENRQRGEFDSEKRPYIEFVKTAYDIDRTLNQQDTLRETARAFGVVSKVLQPGNGGLAARASSDLFVLMKKVVMRINPPRFPGLRDYTGIVSRFPDFYLYEEIRRRLGPIQESENLSRRLESFKWLFGLAQRGEKEFTDRTFNFIFYRVSLGVFIISLLTFIPLAFGVWLIFSSFLQNDENSSGRLAIGLGLAAFSFAGFFCLRYAAHYYYAQKLITRLLGLNQKLTPGWNKVADFVNNFISNLLRN